VLSTLLAAVYALFIWWFSTGLILFLDKRPRRHHALYMALATVIAAGALYAIWITKDRDSVAAMVCAFTAGLTLWGWNEMAFLMGYITGPRKTACPPGARGGYRFGYALQTIVHHEIALLATTSVLIIMLNDAANPFALWTFALLLGARLSAKLNVFLGVRNLAEEFLPDHLAYLASYFRRSPSNPLFPVTVTATSVMTGILAFAAISSPTEAGQVGFTLLTALMALAVIEHWMLVLPIRETALWQWALPAKAPGEGPRDDLAFASPNAQEQVDVDRDYFRLSSTKASQDQGEKNTADRGFGAAQRVPLTAPLSEQQARNAIKA